MSNDETPGVWLHDAFVAVEAATDLRVRATELRRQWDDSFATGRLDGVRSVIAESWTRMMGAGLQPDRLRPSRGLDADGLAAARETSPLRLVLPQLRATLAGLAEDAEHIMVVCDADGMILWLEGHGRVLDQSRGIDFEPGMRWTEDSVGTNAIGTALAIDHAVQIYSAEHFLPEQHPWWCSAAPIHDPNTGALLGVVDLSGPQKTAHPYSLGLVGAAAGLAEEQLRQHLLRVQAIGSDEGSRGNEDGRVVRVEARTRVRLLTANQPQLVVNGRTVPLSLRQAEAIAVLALHPGGLTADDLTHHLYGDQGNPISTRALLSRLRDVVDGVVLTRPYRLADDVQVDLLRVTDRVAEGRGADALRLYPGPLLERSEVETVIASRHEVDASIRRIALAGTSNDTWRWLQTTTGRQDLQALERFLALADEDDPRAGLVESRRLSVLADWS